MQNANVNKMGFCVEADVNNEWVHVYCDTLQEAIDLIDTRFTHSGVEDVDFSPTMYATETQRAEHKKYVMQKAIDILSNSI
jgi:hypothetical protein